MPLPDKVSDDTRRLNPALFQPHDQGGASFLECRDAAQPLEDGRAQANHSGKYFVRVVSYRVVLLDEDNLCEKFHVDGLRYAGLLPDDAPGRCRIITTQEKVRTKAEQRTEIQVDLMP